MSEQKAPVFELRCGGLHVTMQSVPVWLVSLVTTLRTSETHGEQINEGSRRM
nr:hypothetical protein OG999_17210 [Streptomyces sp. NBC_00886]